MLVQQPLKAKLGKILVDKVEYQFKLVKTYKMWAYIELYDAINEKRFIRQITVPKDIAIGAPITLDDGICCLLRSEIKPPIWWTKWAFKKRK